MRLAAWFARSSIQQRAEDGPAARLILRRRRRRQGDLWTEPSIKLCLDALVLPPEGKAVTNYNTEITGLTEHDFDPEFTWPCENDYYLGALRRDWVDPPPPESEVARERKQERRGTLREQTGKPPVPLENGAGPGRCCCMSGGTYYYLLHPLFPHA